MTTKWPIWERSTSKAPGIVLYTHHAQDNRNDINDLIWFNTNQFFLYKNQFRLTNEQIWCWSSWDNMQKHAARNSTRLNLWCYFSPCKWTNKSASLRYFYLCFDLPNSISVAAHTWNWNFCLASWKRMIMFTLINFSHRLDIKKGMYPLWHNLVYFKAPVLLFWPPQCWWSADRESSERFLAKFGHRPDHKAKPCTIVKEGGAGYREQNIFVAACKAHLFPL